MNVRRLLAMIGIAAGLLTLASCVERKEVGTLNADGSGKAVVDVLVASPGPDVVAFGRTYAEQMIQHTQGAAAWNDFTIEAAADGRAHIRATVYFADVSKFRLDRPFQTMWDKNADGTYTFKMQKEQAASQPASPQMTDEQVAQAIATARANYKQQQPAMQLLLNNLKLEMTFELPGEVTATSIFEKTGSDQVTLKVDGKQVMAAMDKIMGDEKLLAGAIKNGTTPRESDELLMENLFGKKGAVSATVAGRVGTLFDYKSEAAAAKAGQAAAFAKAGIGAAATEAGK
ncbi:MAG TPA: hypothetical protein VM008_06300 [Phycisphaerae bacterium]|nr:hypothetical protein [Phycisphaerae bacterium]